MSPLATSAGRQPDSFQQHMDSASGLNVDVTHLRNMKAYLEKVAEALRADVVTVARQADEKTRVGRYAGSAFGSDRIREVGTAGSGAGLAGRSRAIADAVNANLADIIRSLTDTAQAIDRIASTYKQAEQLNKLSAADVGRFLSTPTATTHPTTTPRSSKPGHG